MVASAAPAVTERGQLRPPAARRARPPSARCRRRPAWRRTSAPPRFAAPVASNSRFALTGGSSARAKARPAAIDSVKLIKAIPSAPGSSRATSAGSGRVSDGKPCGIRPTIETPIFSSPRNHAAAMPPATATSGAGECGHSRSIAISTAKVARATASVIVEVSGMWCDDADGIEEEAVLRDVDAQQLRHLVEHDHQPDAGLESGKHRRRDEVGDEAESQ